MRLKTLDRSAFYTVESLGRSREITPEGFLLCKGAAIARTGTQLYSTDEVPLEDTGSGEIRIERTPEEVFREETISSFEGKPVTVEHPTDFVTPENWNQLAVGIVQNVRRGEGLEGDLLIADLLITQADAIAYVNKELPELSAGYEAEYVQIEPGRGIQKDIIGNHVALVERGRAGPRCSIKDHQPERERPMKKKRSVWDRLMTAVKARDEEAIKAELESKDADEPEKQEQTAKAKDEAGDINARLARIEAVLAKLVPAEEREHGQSFDENGKEAMPQTSDEILNAETAEKNSEAVGRVLSGDSLKQIVARAEILSPGIAIPTGDAIKSKDAAPKLMRKALENAYGTETGKACVDTFLMGRELQALTGDALMGVFNGAAELMRIKNNDAGVRHSVTTKDFGKAMTPAEINARNRAHWANR